MSTTSRRPMPAFALFAAFFEVELKRFAEMVKLSGYKAE
jgi:hypothetical protein